MFVEVLILFGEQSLRRVLAEYLIHRERNHQGKDNLLLFPDASSSDSSLGLTMRCREHLGGLLKFYSRAA
jgi:putative transposase